MPDDLTPTDAATWARVWELMEEQKDAVERVLLDRVRAIPALAALLADLDPDDPIVLAERERSREITRRALLEGDWDPYLAKLHEDGVRYARMGIPLADWFRLLSPYRAVLVPAALAREDGRELVLAIDRFVDRAMREIGEAYVQEKEALLRVAEGQTELYAKLFRNCPLGLAINRFEADGARVTLDMNVATRGIREALASASPAEIDAQRERYTALTRRALETGEPVEATSTIGPTILRQWIIPLDERHVGSVTEDVTEKERVTRALRRTNADLNRSNQDLDEFAYVASHDLRAPLRDIENLSRWLQEDLGDGLPAASQRHVTRLRERVARMERLLEDLLQYSRAGRVGAAAQAMDLDQAVASAVAMAGVPSTFSIEVQGPPLALSSPRAPLELVLRNLVANAVKHHHAGVGRIEVSWERQGDAVEIVVADDGPGVPPEYRDRVFQMFQTLKPRDAVEGSGMGLAIVRRVVEAHGGSVRVESRGDGGGAVFRFTWPVDWNPDANRVGIP